MMKLDNVGYLIHQPKPLLKPRLYPPTVGYKECFRNPLETSKIDTLHHSKKIETDEKMQHFLFFLPMHGAHCHTNMLLYFHHRLKSLLKSIGGRDFSRRPPIILKKATQD